MNGTLDKRSEGAFYFKGMLDIGQKNVSQIGQYHTNIGQNHPNIGQIGLF